MSANARSDDIMVFSLVASGEGRLVRINECQWATELMAADIKPDQSIGSGRGLSVEAVIREPVSVGEFPVSAGARLRSGNSITYRSNSLRIGSGNLFP